MFRHLSIKNYILIEELEIDLTSGLTIITGETGAGKSILLGALGLLTGQRADSSTLLDKQLKCVVEGMFAIAGSGLEEFFSSNDLDYAPDTILRREISPDGRSRAFVNDSPVNLSILRELGSQLIDIHSQHQNVYLQTPAFQMQVLDLFAGQQEKCEDYRRNFSEYRRLNEQLEELCRQSDAAREELDYARYQLEQLEAARLKEGEQEALEQELEALTHAEEIKAALMQASELSGDGEEVVSVVMQLRSGISALHRIEPHYPRARAYRERLESVLIELRDVAADCARLSESTEYEPGRITFIQERLSTLFALQQKYKTTSVAGLLALRDQWAERIEQVEGFEQRIMQARLEAGNCLEGLTRLGRELSEERRACITPIEGQVQGMLRQLGMPNGRFVISFTQRPLPGPSGFDEVRFLFSANKQQQPDELGKVASGGEMSRLMLSIKATVAEKMILPTIIFDEIDSGVSGEIASKMGSILAGMSAWAQIINITHLPQVAAKGHQHLKVFKRHGERATHTYITALEGRERLEEIARLLSGEQLTQAAMDNARELLGPSAKVQP